MESQSEHSTCTRVFYGAVTTTQATVYLETMRPEVPLSGYVDGPYSELATTLPARAEFQSRGSQPTALATADIIDPCFWTPGLPVTYRVVARVGPHGDQQELQTNLGFRTLGARGKQLFWDSRRWVMRAVSVPAGHSWTQADWEWLRETKASLILRPETMQGVEAASLQGVPVLLDCRAIGPECREVLAQAAHHPACCMALLPACRTQSLRDLRAEAPNLLLATWTSDAAWGDPDASLLDRSEDQPDLLVLQVQQPNDRLRTLAREVRCPLFAMQTPADPCDLMSARRACDRLQQDLAPFADLAGYLIG